MQSQQNYTPFVIVGFIFTAAILVVFQLYLFREPGRIAKVMEVDRMASVAAGRDLYEENCDDCHGGFGEGGLAPPLNSRQLLEIASDAALFNLTANGIPGTSMPAWGQEFGGPFTDEEISQLVAFIRSWQSTAPVIEEVVNLPDPIRGATIFATICFVCHGENGQGTEITRALNDPSRLRDFDNAWYRSTISFGRPAKGMPTWGTVLSPQQIDDMVALIDAWRSGETVLPEISIRTRLKSALFALRQFNNADALLQLNAGLTFADSDQAEIIREIITLVEDDKIASAKNMIIVLLPPTEIGEELYLSYCAACHGSDGSGGLGGSLNDNEFIQTQDDSDLVEFLMEGRSGTAMEGFRELLLEQQIENLVAFLRTIQE